MYQWMDIVSFGSSPTMPCQRQLKWLDAASRDQRRPVFTRGVTAASRARIASP